jgi:hypothetical protein
VEENGTPELWKELNNPDPSNDPFMVSENEKCDR